jgi:hypothetical protein
VTTATLLATVTADSGRHSAKVTDWTDRVGWIVGLLLVVALVYWLMRQGWQWRRTLQGGLPALPQPPEDPGTPLLTLEGRYHGSTTAGQWLDRIVAHGLGVRSKVRLTLTERGLVVDRAGAPGFFVPAAALRGARLDRAIAGKVLPEGGLLVVTWEHGGTLIDSGFRGDRAADHPAWAERIGELSGDRAVVLIDGPNPNPGSGPAGRPATAASPHGSTHDTHDIHGSTHDVHDTEHDTRHDREGAQ